MSSQSEEMRSMVAGFKLTVSGDFNQALRAGGRQSGYMHNPVLPGTERSTHASKTCRADKPIQLPFAPEYRRIAAGQPSVWNARCNRRLCFV
jgi:hypothetical protein